MRSILLLAGVPIWEGRKSLASKELHRVQRAARRSNGTLRQILANLMLDPDFFSVPGLDEQVPEVQIWEFNWRGNPAGMTVHKI